MSFLRPSVFIIYHIYVFPNKLYKYVSKIILRGDWIKVGWYWKKSTKIITDRMYQMVKAS